MGICTPWTEKCRRICHYPPNRQSIPKPQNRLPWKRQQNGTRKHRKISLSLNLSYGFTMRASCALANALQNLFGAWKWLWWITVFLFVNWYWSMHREETLACISIRSILHGIQQNVNTPSQLLSWAIQKWMWTWQQAETGTMPHTRFSPQPGMWQPQAIIRIRVPRLLYRAPQSMARLWKLRMGIRSK